MPPRLMTATSLVPPPMSTTMLPVASDTGRPAPRAAPLFVSWRRLKCFRRQTGQRWKAQALNVGGGVSALVVLLHLAHLVGSEEGLQVVHLSLELTADIGL